MEEETRASDQPSHPKPHSSKCCGCHHLPFGVVRRCPAWLCNLSAATLMVLVIAELLNGHRDTHRFTKTISFSSERISQPQAMSDDHRVGVERLNSQSDNPTFLESTTPPTHIPVFYNVYVANRTEHDRVQHLVMDQLSYLKSYHHPVFVHTIGYPLSIPNTTLLEHHTTASEHVTLHSLWDYCQSHPQDKVVYLHSKGSLRVTRSNDRLRQLSTLGALSDECATHTDNIVSNLCSYRISPFPHPHVPGNMWLAHCSYVKNLLEPNIFQEQMNTVRQRLEVKPHVRPSFIGNGRYSAEHWIHTHPSAKPSDLYTNSEYSWGYNITKEHYEEGDFEWKLAPRYGIDHWPQAGRTRFSDLTHRLKEFRLLYNITPEKDWWGWNFWLDTV
jgi:hypothetical protein